MNKPVTTGASLVTAMVMLSLLLAPAVYAQEVTAVRTNKTEYTTGDQLIVSGTATGVVAGFDVSIRVLDPRNNVRVIDQATPAADGSFSKTVFTFAATDPAGGWTVTAAYRGATRSTGFTFTPAVVAPPAVAAAALTVEVRAPTSASPGEIIEIYVLITFQGTYVPVANFTPANIGGPAIPHIHGPDGAVVSVLTMTKIHNGLWRSTFAVPVALGTYTIVIPVGANSTTAISAAAFRAVEAPATAGALAGLSSTIATDVIGRLVFMQTTLTGAVAFLDGRITAVGRNVTRVSTAIATLQTSVNGLSTKLDTVQKAITDRVGTAEKTITDRVAAAEKAVTDRVATLSTDIRGAITAAQTAITGRLDAAQKAVTDRVAAAEKAATDSVTKATTDIRGAITAAQGALSTAISGAQRSADAAKSAADAARTDIKTVSDATAQAGTFILVVGALAAITLVLELVILVRKLS